MAPQLRNAADQETEEDLDFGKNLFDENLEQLPTKNAVVPFRGKGAKQAPIQQELVQKVQAKPQFIPQTKSKREYASKKGGFFEIEDPVTESTEEPLDPKNVIKYPEFFFDQNQLKLSFINSVSLRTRSL